MQALFTSEYAWLWAIALALALFYPVRQLIWSLSVRRAQAREPVDAEKSLALKRRATITAALLCFAFSWLYTYNLMHGR